MSAELIEWIIVLIFLLFVFGLTFVEAIWLNKQNWTSFGKSLAFAVATNVIGFFVGFFMLFLTALGIFMFVWDGAIDNYRYGEWFIIAGIVFCVLFFPLFLAICKLLFLKNLKIQTGKAAWVFSFVSSFLIAFLSLTIPILLGYFMLR